MTKQVINFNSHPSLKVSTLADIFFSNKVVNWFLFTLSAIQNYIMRKNVWQNIKIKVKQVHSAKCKIAFCLCFLSFVHFQYFSIINKCNMRRVQHGKRKECNMNATWKKCNMEKVQHWKSATWKKRNTEKRNMQKVQHWKRGTCKKCNMEKVQHENSRGVARTPRASKTENFASMFKGFDNYYWKPLHRRYLWVPVNTSGSSTKWTKCNRKNLQHGKSATCEECNTKTL